MPDETHKLQKQPAEGSRKVIERELERQSKETKDKDIKKDRPDAKGEEPRR